MQMGYGLGAAAGQLHVPECAVVQHAEVLAALGRDVDVTGSRERGRGDPEHLLLQDPVDHRLWDRLVECAHVEWFWCSCSRTSVRLPIQGGMMKKELVFWLVRG